MKMEQCPICFNELEVRECAPCHDCGWNVPTEIEHLKEGRHTYTVYDVYKGLTLTLCNFCAVDFGSYKPEYLGFHDDKRIGFEDFNYVKSIDHPVVEKDKFCPECGHRLKFLIFLRDLRELIEKEDTHNTYAADKPSDD